MYSLIIPVYNEAQSINDVLTKTLTLFKEQVRHNAYEIIVVDDGSTDTSGEIITAINDKHIAYIRHPERRGVGAARSTGVIRARGERILFIDADMTYDPYDLLGIIEKLDAHDMVIGSRTKEKGTLPLLRASIKGLYCILASILTKKRIPDLNSGMRGMSRTKALEFLPLLPTGHSWVSTITLCFLASGYTVSFLPIPYQKRRGKSSFNILSDTYSLFLTILKTIVYFYPLRVIMPMSIAFFIGGISFLIRDFIQRDIADTTLVLIVVSILLFVFALISEQLACLRRELTQKKHIHE